MTRGLGQPPQTPLTYRSSTSGKIHAAYLGNCRVGYVEQRDNGMFMWQSIFLQPTGGAYIGKESTEGDARMLLEMSVHNWLAEAGLQLKETENVDQRRDQGPLREDQEAPTGRRERTAAAARRRKSG